MKLDALHQFKQAQMIASYVSCMLSENAEEPKLWAFYPDLFEEEKRQQEQALIDAQLALHKERMRLLAERLKNRFTSAE